VTTEDSSFTPNSINVVSEILWWESLAVDERIKSRWWNISKSWAVASLFTFKFKRNSLGKALKQPVMSGTPRQGITKALLTTDGISKQTALRQTITEQVIVGTFAWVLFTLFIYEVKSHA